MCKTKMGVGVVGCGNISNIYLTKLAELDCVELVACTDLKSELAASKVTERLAPKAVSVDEIFEDDAIDIILNITPPAGHFEVAMRALKAGKNVYNEKPFALEVSDGLKLLAEAKERGLRLGCAPDTFLGAAHQEAAELIRGGAIGEVVGATVFMMGHGPESWHPSPAFYYKKGGGPLLDMGPYYLTALVNMLGPIARVAGFAVMGQKTRTCTTEARMGEVIEVETPTHIAGNCEFSSGAIATLIMSFDVWGHNLPCIEIHGTKGSLSVPDPNKFGGELKIKRKASDWEVIENSRPYFDNWRGLGLADMANSIMQNKPHRASGRLAMHVLEAMAGLLQSAEDSKFIELTTSVDSPELLPSDIKEGSV